MPLIYAALLSGSAIAGDLVVPQAKLHINVVQWSPISGTYENWAAVGGDVTVSADSTINVPGGGTLNVAGLDAPAIAAAYSEALRDHTGLVSAPEVTVQIIQYPPIYVVGDVEAPGVYDFKPGLTPLHALALGGGERRAAAGVREDRARASAELQEAENSIALSKVRMARLEAERTSAPSIDFPEIRSPSVSTGYSAELVEREQSIFDARRRELARQRDAIGELRELLKSEIDVMEQKMAMSEKAIATAEEELASVSTLVERGIAVASRRSDLARLLDSLQAGRLDQTTAIMRARQNIASATRDFDGLEDKFQTSVAAELQSEKAALEAAMLKRDLALQLSDAMPDGSAGAADESRRPKLVYSIVRVVDGRQVDLPADDSTLLQPADLVRIEFAQKPVPGVASSDQPDEIPHPTPRATNFPAERRTEG